METNEITAKQTSSYSKPTMYKINTKCSNVFICDFEQVNLCIYIVT